MNTKTLKPGFLRLLKLPAILFLLLLYLGTSLVVAAIPLSGNSRLRLRTKNVSFFSRLALALFRVRVRAMHQERLAAARACGCLIVANHVSYVDVLALAAVIPAVFITSVELRSTPLLGLIARSAGCLFVDRRKASGLKQEIKKIAAVLGGGLPVILFPEATTSNGDHVHPFKRSLFDAAVAAGSDILPVCLRYTRINGHPVSPENRDRLFYYGDITFSRHLPAFLSLASVDLRITPLPVIRIHAASSRKDAADQAHDAISREYERG